MGAAVETGTVLTRVFRLGVVRIFLSSRRFFRLCAGKGRYLDARHCDQYPQHTDERLLTTSPSNHPNDVYVSFFEQGSRRVLSPYLKQNERGLSIRSPLRSGLMQLYRAASGGGWGGHIFREPLRKTEQSRGKGGYAFNRE